MRKRKDILFLCQFFYPEYISSATLPYDTARALKRAGFSVDVLCGYPKEYAAGEKAPMHEIVNGLEIGRVKYLQLGRKGVLGRLINYFSFTFMMALRLFQMAKYKVVVVYSNPPLLPWVASWAKMLFGTKLIFVAYDLYPEIAVRTGTLRQGNIICRLMNHVNKCVFRRADGVVALSREMADFIQKERDIAPERIFVIPNWYEDNPSISEVSSNGKFRKLADGRFVISYFGNLGTAQDMETILGAMRELKNDPKFCFIFAGHGNKMEVLKTVIRREGFENAYQFDFLRGEDFQAALDVSDCALISLERGLTGLCVPSKTYSYMMQGIPLLAIMDRGDIVRDIEQGAGYWVRNGESSCLTEKIRQMEADRDTHEKMRCVCRKIYLEKYTTRKCTDEYIKMIRTMI